MGGLGSVSFCIFCVIKCQAINVNVISENNLLPGKKFESAQLNMSVLLETDKVHCQVDVLLSVSPARTT